MNRKKKISQKIAKRLKNASAKKSPKKKERYIPKAEREAMALEAEQKNTSED
ncbi:DUF2986 domain-containing protein [Hydrogenovibrio sp. 3SP14C1]|uniref:DUF2986 domain-containing protein n=1 Tax=Hydrogenovibrio sp. 3SP14C1 TaxID=3038774 RepID=UPI002416489F|nr:DUF2986 domain-containing protein [Hydrogenovibrio sp. 3SP14C1]MDG4813493.1 DUF2986 domain-containing protein [Hydrogenovibrio sp. 3SP14C1]